jgi:hypothetical protein
LSAIAIHNPFTITTVGTRRVEGRFKRKAKDVDALAERLHRLAPRAARSPRAMAERIRRENAFAIWWK